jgi:hypothetical protein
MTKENNFVKLPPEREVQLQRDPLEPELPGGVEPGLRDCQMLGCQPPRRDTEALCLYPYPCRYRSISM